VEISGGSPTQSTGRAVLVTDKLLRRLDASLACSNFCRFIKLKKPAYSKFVYLWLRKLYTNDELLQFENGTTGIKNFAFTLFSSSYKVCVPPEILLEKFDELNAPLFDRLQSSADEADTLGDLRDTLLPKLISGELRVKEADKAVWELA
jgi:type I restriction enzyme S subunit